MYKKTKEVTFHVNRNDSHFDRACDEANRRAWHELDLTDKDEDRRDITIEVEFVAYKQQATPVGGNHQYTFIVRLNEEE